MALTAVVPPSRVAKQLRLRLADLKKQIATRQAVPTAMTSYLLGFVEVPPAPARPQTAAMPQIELHRADGARLCIHAPESTLPLAALVRAFLEGHSCCSSPPKAAFLWRPNRSISGKALMGSVPCVGRVLGENPLEGAVYVFRNRAGTALKLLLYDGQGYWLMMKRLSQGRFTWWPTSVDARVPLSARELIIVLWNGNPERAQMARDWRRVA